MRVESMCCRFCFRFRFRIPLPNSEFVVSCFWCFGDRDSPLTPHAAKSVDAHTPVPQKARYTPEVQQQMVRLQ